MQSFVTPPAPATDGAPRLLIGLDAGKVTTSLAWGRVGADGALVVEGSSAARHHGEPLAPFFALYRALGAAPGRGRRGDGRLRRPPDGAPRSAASPRRSPRSGRRAPSTAPTAPLTVVRIGGSGYSVLTRDAAGRIDYERNERCSAGTGETVEGLCGAARSRSRRGHRPRRSRRPRHHRHLALRRLRQERAHALRQPGRRSRAPLSRTVRERGAQRARALRPYQGRRPGRADRSRRPDRPTRLRLPRARRGARARSRRRPACSRRWARCSSPPRATGATPSGPPRPKPSWSSVASRARPARRRPTDRARSCSSTMTAADDAASLRRAPTRRPPTLCLPRSCWASTWVRRDRRACWIEPRSGAVLADVYRRTDGNPVEAAKRLVADLRDGAAARPGGRGRPHRVGARRGGDRACAPPTRGLAGRPHRAERDRGARRRRRALRPRRRPQPLDRRDRRSGRQVHQRARRARGRIRHEPRLQRRHGLVPRGAGAGPRARRHRRVRRAGGPLRAAARPRPDLHGVRRRRRRRGAVRRLHPRTTSSPGCSTR